METQSLPEDRVIKIGDISLHYPDWGNPDAVPIEPKIERRREILYGAPNPERGLTNNNL
jgi:hypothetical protein